MMNRLSSFRFSPAALSALAISGLGALNSSAYAQVSARATFRPYVVSFSPLDPPVYVMFMELYASGFADDTNIGNHIQLGSGDNSFNGDAHPGQGTGGSSSSGFLSAAELADVINNSGSWTLTLTDGLTGGVSDYTLSVSSPGIPAEFLRPIVLDVQPNSMISEFPTFPFSIEPTANPAAEYSFGFAGLFGNINSYFTPGITPQDTSWTPDGPLADGTYLLDVQMHNFSSDPSLVQATFPVAVDNAPELASFDQFVAVGSESQASALQVGITPPAQFTVTTSFDISALLFSPLDLPIYIMTLGMQASGFTDEGNLDNFVRLASPDGFFSGEFHPATGAGSGGSIGLFSVEDLASTINSLGAWTLTLNDGATGLEHLYSINVTTPGISADLVRPITLDVAPGDVISSNPTFGLSLDPAQDPGSEYDNGYAFLLGQIPGNYYGSPGFTPGDTSWTPDGPVTPDTYTVVIAQQNTDADASIIVTDLPVAQNPGSPEVTFSHLVVCATYGQTGNLTVGAYCPADFNQDGGIDGADVDSFFQEWEAGNAAADTNQDGGVDGADVQTFFAAWENGGC